MVHRNYTRRAARIFILAALACCLSVGSAETESVQDESLRLEVLRAIFPGAEISRVSSSSGDRTLSEDALVDEPTYSVTGSLRNEAENCASVDVGTGMKSTTREVRLRVFRPVGKSAQSLVAVLQYKFADVNPAGACWSIGMAARVDETQGRSPTLRAEFLLRTFHHSGLKSIRMIDLAGDGTDRLMVDSDWGGAGVGGGSYYIFDLRADTLHPVFVGVSWMNGDPGIEDYELDVTRTRLRKAKSFCFTHNVLLDTTRPPAEPKISHPCFRTGSGVRADRQDREWLE